MVKTTVVNYVIEGRPDDSRPWVALQFAGDNPGIAGKAFENWAAARGTLQLQLVKRTVDITDEVARTGRQGDPGDENWLWEED